MEIIGSDANETLNGTAGIDLIIGLGGNDIINGNGGDDQITGGQGVDVIDGGGDDDLIFGDNGDGDPFTGGSDTIHGGTGDDTIVSGYYGGDFYGDADNDQFYYYGGNAGFASFHGGSASGAASGETDIIYVTDFGASDGGHPDFVALNIAAVQDIDAIINGSFRPGYIYSVDGGGTLDLRSVDLIVGFSGIRGSSQNDTIYGQVMRDTITSAAHGVQIEGFEGNDNLFGTALNDHLIGGNGDDTLFALGSDSSTGIDVLTGGAGLDWFVFGANDGTSEVTDFTHGDDLIIVGSDVTTINLFAAAGTGDAILQLDNTFVLLEHYAATSFSAADLAFA